MVEFRVVRSFDSSQFEVQVAGLLGDGWELHGGLQTVTDIIPREERGDRSLSEFGFGPPVGTLFCQALVRYVGNEKVLGVPVPEFVVPVQESVPEVPPLRSIAEVEREYILGALERFRWNKSAVARVLGVERSTLDRKLRSYGVSRPS